MTFLMHKTQSPMPRSRRLKLEPLEARLCLSTYATVDLIPLPGHNSSEALGLNDHGLVVGRSRGEVIEAVVWSVDPAGTVSVSELQGRPPAPRRHH